MGKFLLYWMVVHLFCKCTIIAFTLKHTMDRLTYVEDRLNAESKVRRNDFNALFQKLESVETLLLKVIDEKDVESNSANTGTIPNQFPFFSDDRVKVILNAFKEEKIQNHRFRREITVDLNKQNELTMKGYESLEQRLNDIAKWIELMKDDAKHQELIAKKASEKLQQTVEGNAKSLASLVEITKQTGKNISLNFIGIRQSLNEQEAQSRDTKDACLNVTNVLAENTVESKKKYGSCLELYRDGFEKNGVYEIMVDNTSQSPNSNVPVYCDMTTDNGGWTVFQRRQDGSVDFYRDWNEYKHGFGDLEGEFWLGNEYINRLTDDGKIHELRIDMEDYEGSRAYAKYRMFKVSQEKSNYTLEVSGYTGDAGDSLHKTAFKHSGMQFSTKDIDNDKYSGNCASHGNGAWWYNSCFASNLNGLYIKQSTCGSATKCIAWSTWGGHKHNLKFTEMKFK